MYWCRWEGNYIWEEGEHKKLQIRLNAVANSVYAMAARYYLKQFGLSSWWEWEADPRYLFYRWTPLFHQTDWDIQNYWVTQDTHQFTNPQLWVRYDAQKEKKTSEISRSQKRDCIYQGEAIRSTQLFLVLKGVGETRMV